MLSKSTDTQAVRGTRPGATAPEAQAQLPELAPTVLVTGKGGVGKTAVSAALAQGFATLGERTAFVCFSEAGWAGRGLSAEVEQVVLDMTSALEAMAISLLGSGTLAKLLVHNFAMRRLLNAAPALHELATLHAVQALRAEGWERVVVDMPASGHGLMWLSVPAQLMRLLRVGPLYELAATLGSRLRDPAETSLAVVTLAEPLVMSETIELLTALRKGDRIAARLLVVNHMPASHRLATAELGDAQGEEVSPGRHRLRDIMRAREARLDAVQHLAQQLDDEHVALLRVPAYPETPTLQQLGAALGFPTLQAHAAAPRESDGRAR